MDLWQPSYLHIRQLWGNQVACNTYNECHAGLVHGFLSDKQLKYAKVAVVVYHSHGSQPTSLQSTVPVSWLLHACMHAAVCMFLGCPAMSACDHEMIRVCMRLHCEIAQSGLWFLATNTRGACRGGKLHANIWVRIPVYSGPHHMHIVN
jgi:hypothetical protein